MDKELLEYFNGDDLAASVWLSKYAAEGETHPDQMHLRMAKEFARIEKKYIRQEDKVDTPVDKLSKYGSHRMNANEESIYNFFKDFKYIVPQGSIMATLGTAKITSLSNCVVVHSPKDSYNSIMWADTQLTALYRRRCGVGLDISNIRPVNAAVNNAAKNSTGSTSFMDRFSNTTREVASEGRRGALMLSIDVDHPDTPIFAKIKTNLTKVTGANISIRLNDEFIRAAENDEDYILRFPCNTKIASISKNCEYDKLYSQTCPTRGNTWYYKKVKAKDLWKKIIASAHLMAEPGLLFWDRILNYSPDGVYDQFKPICTNPCGEIPMSFDSCRLMITNLFSFVNNPFTDKAEFDFNKFYEVNYEAMRLMDDLIDLEIEHIDRILAKIDSDPETVEEKLIERTTWEKLRSIGKEGRRTGLGVTALGDTLAALGLKYDSDEGIAMTDKIFSMKMESELDCSIDLAILRGAFIGWDVNKEYGGLYPKLGKNGSNKFYIFLQDNFPHQYKRMIKYGRRNVSWSTCAPTGTTSLMTQTTSGIEPVFQPYYKRRKKINPNDKDTRVDFTDQSGDTWQEYFVIHTKFKDWIFKGLEQPTTNYFTEEALKQFFEKSPWYQSTANDIDWIKRVEIQGVIQNYISHSISSTINLPKNVSVEEVGKIYLEAHKKGLKGVTVYRDGSRDGVLVNEDTEKVAFEDTNAPKRPKIIPAKIIRFQNNLEKWVSFIGLVNDRPYEIFTGLAEVFDIPSNVEEGVIRKGKTKNGKKKYDFEFDSSDGSVVVENLSKAFRKEYWNYAKLISSLLRHGMPLPHLIKTIDEMSFDTDHINTWKNGVVRGLKKFIKNNVKSSRKCLDCGGENVIFENGCEKCLDCGSSKCG